MRLSVLIPTYQRPDAIDNCLVHLARQSTDARFEIIVGIDGDETPDPAVPEPIRRTTRLVRMPRLGVIGVRKELLRLATGETVLWLNDDSYAHPGLLDAHLSMHTSGHETQSPRVVSGAVQWKPIPTPYLFDRLVQSTGIIFFEQPPATDPHTITYRNCFGLNMSFPLEFARKAGGVPDIKETYGYDDIELAHRLGAAGAQIWRAPDALVTHDHRMTPLDIHRREYLLGRTAWLYAGANPRFASDLFGRDIRSDDELVYTRNYLQRERADAQRLERTFLDLDRQPASGATPDLLPVIAQQWTLLKRYLWRWGLLDAARGTPARWGTLADAPPCLTGE